MNENNSNTFQKLSIYMSVLVFYTIIPYILIHIGGQLLSTEYYINGIFVTFIGGMGLLFSSLIIDRHVVFNNMLSVLIVMFALSFAGDMRIPTIILTTLLLMSRASFLSQLIYMKLLNSGQST